MILFLGIVLRCIYVFLPRARWGDESYSYELAQKPWPDYLGLSDVHPPLWPILCHLFPSRIIPLIAGVISLWLFQRLVKDKLAVFVFAVSPYFIHLSGEMRGYGLLLMFSLLVMSGYKWAFPFAVMTEYYAWFLLLLLPISMIVLPWMMLSGGIAISQMGAEQVFAQGRGWEWSAVNALKKLSGLAIQFAGGIQNSFLTAEQARSVMMKPQTYLWFIPTIFALYSRNKKYIYLTLVPIAALFLLYPIRLNARYLPFAAVAYLMIFIGGYRRVEKRHKFISRILMSGYLLMLLCSLSRLLTTDYDPYHREGWFECERFLKENVKPYDHVFGALRFIKYRAPENISTGHYTFWELVHGNPDMEVQYKHLAQQEKKLGRKGSIEFKGGDLAYVFKYE